MGLAENAAGGRGDRNGDARKGRIPVHMLCSLAVAVMLAAGCAGAAHADSGGAACTAESRFDVPAPVAGRLGAAAAESGAGSAAKSRSMSLAEFCRLYAGAIRGSDMGTVMVETARLFLGVPYVPNTLEAEEERLTIRLDALDCSTFVDTVLALSRSLLLSGEKSRVPGLFLDEIRAIRYRNGRVDGYTDRLHYTTAWLAENERTGRIRDITAELGGVRRTMRLTQMSDFMTRDARFIHRPDLVGEMRRQEAVLSGTEQRFIPTKDIPSILKRLRPGDIICLAAARPDWDMVHVAIFAGTTAECGEPTIIHASSKAGRVLVEPEGLAAYMRKRKNSSGIIVARPADVTR